MMGEMGPVVTADWLAAFLRRERNSLHYRGPLPNGVPAQADAFARGYTTAIDGLLARLARELREKDQFDESRFLAMAEGRFSADDVFDANGKRLGSRSEIFGGKNMRRRQTTRRRFTYPDFGNIWR